MRRILGTALVIGSGLLAGSCAARQADTLQAPVLQAAPGTELRLESITPQEGAAIGKETSDPGVTAGDDTGAGTLFTPSGRCELVFPMDVVWSSTMIKRPFVVWFYLTKGTEPGASTLVARAGPVRFPAN